MNLVESDKRTIIDTLQIDFRGKTDGGRRNLLFPRCPFCGHDGYKFGIYIGKDYGGKIFGKSHCFSCGRSCNSLKDTLELLDRRDLLPKETETYNEELSTELALFEDEIDDELVEIEMPKGYKRVFKNHYLQSRGWRSDDYEYFPVGTNRGMDWKLEDYVIIPIVEDGVNVGYVARHAWSKDEIESYNEKHRKKILRYRNSTEADGNGFEKLIYNIDAIVPNLTDTIIVCEGVFDVVGLTRKLELYDNEKIQAVATFGKKLSDTQLYKLQSKGVRTLVLGFDQDAVETTCKIAKELEQYFDVFIVDVPQDWEQKDFDEMKPSQLYELFSEHIKTVSEFNLQTIL